MTGSELRRARTLANKTQTQIAEETNQESNGRRKGEGF